MSKYIGVKLVNAWPGQRNGVEGYNVAYDDGYQSWCPKDVFEKHNLLMQDNPALPSGVSVGPDMVDGFIKETKTMTLDGKTTIVRAVLTNGFVCVESSSCVDPANYDENLGREICLKKIRDEIWRLLGFLLQSAVGGFSKEV